MQHSFKLILNDEVFEVAPFKNLMLISRDISNKLIFSNEHQYEVQSKVRAEVFKEFLQYLNHNDIPEINMNNINEYIELSSEFEVLEENILNKKEEYGEYFINLNGIRRENVNKEKLEEYEKNISEHLDEYIKHYQETLIEINIQTLYNIFNHESRRLTDEDLGYELIKEHFSKKGDYNIFILLTTLDGTKLSRHNIEEIFSHQEERHGYIAKIDFPDLSERFREQQKSKENIELIKQSIIVNRNAIDESKNERNELKLSSQEIFFEMEEEISEIDKINSIKIENMNILHEEETEKIENAIVTLQQQTNEIEQKIKNFLKGEENNEINNIMEKICSKIGENDLQITKLDNKFTHSQKKCITHQICPPFSAELDMESDGILCQLKKKQKSKFDRLFIASQSSNDIYNLIDPNTNDDFGINNIGSFIEIELQEPVNITGIQIFSSACYFPKTFSIEIDEQHVKTIEEATELNGPNQSMTIHIDSKEKIKNHKILIINRGTNWDYDGIYIYIKRIEILSSDSKYALGVFSTLVSQSEDPHKCPVILSALNFDFNTFHTIDSTTNICTDPKHNSWFQVEFTRGSAVLNGFRLKRSNQSKMKSYKIVCTDDAHKTVEKWTTLIEINEETENEHELVDIYEFPEPSPPTIYVRLIQTGQNWNDILYLKFYHFDLFGNYLIT